MDVELRGVTHCLNLKHSNLISVYDIRTDSMGDQWVVMEYVAGESLDDVILRHPNGMPPEEAARWLRGIGAGVACLHDHGIVHRDLKPGNVFLDHDVSNPMGGVGGTVKIGDYGLSKFISCSRRSGQTESVGTVHYMAPEIANGRYGREIDTYALGIILYEMLTGHVPFEGESVGEVLMKHLTAEPDLSKIEEPYREIVRRALTKDPEVRIGSVQEMLAMLPADPTSGPENVPRFAQKIDGWSAAHAAPDGIGAAHSFSDTSVRGMRRSRVRPCVEPGGAAVPLAQHDLARHGRELARLAVEPSGEGVSVVLPDRSGRFHRSGVGGCRRRTSRRLFILLRVLVGLRRPSGAPQPQTSACAK